MVSLARRLILAGAIAVAGVADSPAPAQSPPAGVDVLARGPVHEAFAATAEPPAATPVITRRPPEPVEELPPDERPDGENVMWIPGYWHYDEERTDFIWVSGFWRAAPPGRVWVPGSWREAGGGHQWVPGFWQDVTPATPGAPDAGPPAIEYLPPPPAPLEVTPSIPAPDETSFYVPGTWVYRQRYVWRPGFWIRHRPNWVWTPAYYRWSPAGYVFVDGYWDYPLAARGTLFAPVFFQPGIVRPAFVYTPYVVVNEPSLHTSLFVRRGWGNYYFGDYFEPRYSQIGFNAWFGTPRGSGFAIGVTVGNARPHYDPLWNYYRIQNSRDPQWAVNINNVYVGRYNGTVPRPPRTLVQQTTIVNNVTNVTNVTNNTTVVNNNAVHNQIMLTSLKEVNKTNSSVVLKPVANDQRVAEQKAARELRDVAAQRQRLEARLAQQGPPTAPAAGAPPATIQSIKLDTPRQAVARAQLPTDEKKAPPPPAAKLKIDTNAAGTVGTPGSTPTLPGRGNARPTTPAPAPTAPKIDPKTPVPTSGLPKVDPKPAPIMADPKKGGTNPVLPKVDPKPPTPAPAPTPISGGTTMTPKGEGKPVAPPPAPAPTIKPPNTDPAPRRGTDRTVDPPKVIEVKPAPVPTPPSAPRSVAPPPLPTPAPRSITPPPPAPTPAPRSITPPPPAPTPAPRSITPPPPAPTPAPRSITPPPTTTTTPTPVINPAPKPAPPASGNGGNGGNRGSGGNNNGNGGDGRRGGNGESDG